MQLTDLSINRHFKFAREEYQCVKKCFLSEGHLILIYLLIAVCMHAWHAWIVWTSMRSLAVMPVCELGFMTRMHIPVQVPFWETPEPGTMPKTSLEFRMAPVIRELSPRANHASMEHRWRRGTPYDVNWRSSGYTPTSFVFFVMARMQVPNSGLIPVI